MGKALNKDNGGAGKGAQGSHCGRVVGASRAVRLKDSQPPSIQGAALRFSPQPYFAWASWAGWF